MSVQIDNFDIPKDGTYAVHIHVLNGCASLRWLDNKIFEIKPVVKGLWDADQGQRGFYRCTECNNLSSTKDKFCRYCGAQMEVGE